MGGRHHAKHGRGQSHRSQGSQQVGKFTTKKRADGYSESTQTSWYCHASQIPRPHLSCTAAIPGDAWADPSAPAPPPVHTWQGPRTHHCCYSASQEGLLLSLSSRAHGKFFKMQRWTPFFKKSVFQLVNKGHNSKKLILISFVHLKPKLTTSKMAEFHLESSLPTKINKTAMI